MFNRPYDVADAAVGTVGEDVPEGLASNFAAYQETRARYFMSLQEQMEELARSDAGTDSTDLTIAPSNTPSIQHGAQDNDDGAQWHTYTNDSFERSIPHVTPDSVQFPPESPHRSASFALPPTQPLLALTAPPSPEITPSALPGPSRGRAPTRGRAPGRGDAPDRALRAAMIADGWLSGSQRTTRVRRDEYERWINAGRPANVTPSWSS